MNMAPKKLHNFVKKHPPNGQKKTENNAMADEERRNHGNIHLTKTERILGHENEHDAQTCLNCKKQYMTTKALRRHQENNERCKQIWQHEKRYKQSPPQKDAEKKIQTKQQMLIHKQHNENNEIQDPLYGLDPTGPIDRRKMIYHGTHSITQNPTQAPITYNAQYKQWTCNICGRTENEQDKQNPIIHAHKHKQSIQQKTIHQKPHSTALQKRLQQIRIKTLQLKPEEEKEQKRENGETEPQPTKKQKNNQL